MATERVRSSQRATFLVLASGLCAYSLLQSMVIPVLPALQEELHTTQSDVTWVLTANLLAAAVATPIVGRLGDMFGKRRMFVSVLLVLSVGCLLSALATAMPLMVVGRVLQGVGGGVIPLGYSILRDEYPDRAVAGAIGVLSSLIAVGSGLGLVIAGPIDSALGLDWLFWLPMVVGAVAAAAAFRVIPESRVRTPGRVNWAAALLLSGWLVCVLLGVSRSTTWGWTSPEVLGLLGGGVVLLALWITVESRSAQPLIDMRMMRLRAVWTANLIAFLVGLTIFAAFAFIPQFLQTPPEAGYGFGASISQVGPGAAAADRRRVLRGTARRAAGAPLRGPQRRHLRDAAHRAGLRAGHRRPRRALADRHRVRADGLRHRVDPGVDGEHRRHRRPPRADRRGERDERQHPHHRRLDRLGRDGHRRHLDRPARRPAHGERLHHRLPAAHPRHGGRRRGDARHARRPAHGRPDRGDRRRLAAGPAAERPVTRGPVRSSYRVTFAVLAVGMISGALLQSLVIPALATFQEALGTTQADATWILTSTLLAAAIATPISGRLGDMYGRKPVFVAVLSLTTVGCLVSALADSLPVMLVGRVLQGLGAGVLPIAFGMVRETFPPAKLHSAISNLATLGAVGAGAGVALAGPIERAFGVSGLFWVPLVLLVASVAAAVVLLPSSDAREPGGVSWTAALLLSGWLVCLLLGLSRAPQWGWGSPGVVGLLSGAVLLLVGWVLVEFRARHPLVDMVMMRRRGVWTVNLVALLAGIGLYAAFAFLPQFLQTPPSAGYGFGSSVSESGLVMLVQTGMSFVAGLIAGPLSQRVGSRSVLLGGILCSAAGYAVMGLAHDYFWQAFVAALLIGVGFGTSFAAMANLVVAAVSPEQTGVASGMNANIRTVGGAIGSALMSTVVTASAAPGGLPTERGYTTGFLLLAGASLVAAAAVLLVPQVPRDPVTHEEPDVPDRHPQAALVAGGTVAGTGEE